VSARERTLRVSDEPSGTPACGVCGAPLTADWWEPPTWSFVDVPDRPGVVRPVLDKPIRVDPESGAVCWCPPRPDR
jgi:hypothetical protein